MSSFNRREFLKTTGVASTLVRGDGRSVAIVVDPNDPVASSEPARWAAGALQRSLEQKGVLVRRRDSLEPAPVAALQLVLSGPSVGAALPSSASLTLIYEMSLRLRESVLAIDIDMRALDCIRIL